MNRIDDDIHRLIVDFEEKLGRKVDQEEQAFLHWVVARTRERDECEGFFN